MTTWDLQKWIDQPVTSSRELLAGNWRCLWPSPLVRSLRARSNNLALDWAFHITRELLPRTGSTQTDGLFADLDRLQQWRLDPPRIEVFAELGKDLWYGRARDHACTAMHHLCSDLARANTSDPTLGPNWLVSVPRLLCAEGLGGDDRMELVEWCLTDFEAFTGTVPQREM